MTRIYRVLDAYVTPRRLGRLFASIEIVLDRREGIVLQPDITFIAEGRESVVSDRMWGTPDMVLELTSPFTHAGRLEERISWFSAYGASEYWLVQPEQCELTILHLAQGGVLARSSFDEGAIIQSPLMPDFGRTVGDLVA